MVNNVTLKYVNEFKYLGHVVSNSQLDDADIHRERKKLVKLFAFLSLFIAFVLFFFSTVFGE